MTRRSSRLPRILGVLLLVASLAAVLGAGAIATNAFGAGDRFESLQDRIDRLLAGPPPDRPTLPTVTVTPRPSLATPTPRPTAVPSTNAPAGPSVAPTPEPTPTPRLPVDRDIVDDHDAVFAHQLTKNWCAPAGVQTVLAILRQADTSDAFQNELANRVREWESREDSINGRWGPAAMALALGAYGAGGYEIRAYETRADAMRGAAVAIDATNSPAILLTWRGAHTWVMSGYRADADPAIFPDAVVSGAYILDPWYPWVSSIWGPSDPPGTFQDAAEMERNFLPWKRPEGRYPDRDGKFVVLVPTMPVPSTAR